MWPSLLIDTLCGLIRYWPVSLINWPRSVNKNISPGWPVLLWMTTTSPDAVNATDLGCPILSATGPLSPIALKYFHLESNNWTRLFPKSAMAMFPVLSLTAMLPGPTNSAGPFPCDPNERRVLYWWAVTWTLQGLPVSGFPFTSTTISCKPILFGS